MITQARSRNSIEHSRRPLLSLLSTQEVERCADVVDMALLRAVFWGEPDLYQVADLPSVGVRRLARSGLVVSRKGEWVLTDAGKDLLDDDF